MRAAVVVIILVVDIDGWNATFKMLTLNLNSRLNYHSSPVTIPSRNFPTLQESRDVILIR